jgi:hypothetical protein
MRLANPVDMAKNPKPLKKPTPIEKIPFVRRLNLYQALSHALIRSQVMATMGNALEVDDEGSGPKIISQTLGVMWGSELSYVMVMWTYFATVEATIDFWSRYGFSDSKVDELLENEEYRRIIHNFRNKVFHVTPVTDDAFGEMLGVFEELGDWTVKVQDAMIGYARSAIRGLMESDEAAAYFMSNLAKNDLGH